MSRISWALPLVIFLVVVGLFYVGFSLGPRHELPSPLVDKPFPEFTAKDLWQPERTLQRDALLGRPTLVNVWATWCPTCIFEHEVLMQIAATERVRVVGVNYKDQRGNAITFLQTRGNPYEFVLEDADGLLGIELGVYGAPETFLLDAAGNIVYKRVGDVNERIWREEILPRLEQMPAATPLAEAS